MLHLKGEHVTLLCSRDCSLGGLMFGPYDWIRIELTRDWDVREGAGQGGPWETEGYLTTFIRTLGRIVETSQGELPDALPRTPRIALLADCERLATLQARTTELRQAVDELAQYPECDAIRETALGALAFDWTGSRETGYAIQHLLEGRYPELNLTVSFVTSEEPEG